MAEEHPIEPWMSPSERLSRFRQNTPPPMKRRWPMPYAPTEAQLKELEGIKNMPARLTRFRQMQAEAEQAPATQGEEA
jgi:hypothetical protein